MARPRLAVENITRVATRGANTDSTAAAAARVSDAASGEGALSPTPTSSAGAARSEAPRNSSPASRMLAPRNTVPNSFGSRSPSRPRITPTNQRNAIVENTSTCSQTTAAVPFAGSA